MLNLAILEGELRKLIPEIERQFRKDDGNGVKAQDVILVVGRTGAGKSTLVNYLLGFDFELKEIARIGGGRGRGKIALHWKKNDEQSYLIDSEEAKQELPAKIGVELSSETLYPTFYLAYSKQLKKEFIICDCPGLGENRGPELSLITTLGVDLTIRAAENLRTVLLLISYPAFANIGECDPKADHILGTLNALQGIVKSPTDLNKLNFRFAFTKIPPNIDQEDILADLPDDINKIRKHFDKLAQKDSKFIEEIIKNNTKILSKIFGAVVSSSLEERVDKLLEDPKTPEYLKEELQAYKGRDTTRRIQLGLLEKIENSSNLLFPTITDGGVSRERLLGGFSQISSVPEENKKLISFSNNSAEREQLDQRIVIRCVENTSLINLYSAKLKDIEKINKKLTDYNNDIESKKNQIKNYENQDIHAVIAELEKRKKEREEELVGLQRYKNTLRTDIATFENRIAELTDDKPILYRDEVKDYSKLCNDTAGDAYRSAWSWFQRKYYLYYEAGEDLNFPVESLDVQYSKEKADTVTFVDKVLERGRYRIKYTGSYGKDSDLKVGVYVRTKYIPGNYAAVNGENGLKAQKLRTEQEREDLKILIETKKRELADVQEEIKESKANRMLEITHIIPSIEAKIRLLEDNLAHTSQKAEQLNRELEAFKEKHFKDIISIYRLAHFIHSNIPITCNLERLNEFFALYEKLIKPFEVQYADTVHEKSEEDININKIKSVIKVALAQPFSPIEGLEYQAVPDKGHCFYQAVGLYFNKDKDELRQIVADYLETHEEELSAYAELPLNTSYAEYVKLVRDTNEWAGNLEIEALMRILQRPIVIIGPDRKIINRADINRFPGEPVFVYYNNINHYDGLVLSQYESNPRNILNKLLTSMGSMNDDAINIEQAQAEAKASDIHFVADKKIEIVEVEQDILLEKSQQYGFKYEEASQTNNNFFESACAQLNKVGIGLDVDRVRENIVEQIAQNFDDYKNDNIKNIQQFMEYLQNNEIDLNVNEIVIQALADKFSLTIVLIRSNQAVPTIIKPRDGVSQGVAYLGYDDKAHFQSLIRDEKVIEPQKLELKIEKIKLVKEISPSNPGKDKEASFPSQNIKQYVSLSQGVEDKKSEIELEDLAIGKFNQEIIKDIPPAPLIDGGIQSKQIERGNLLASIREHNVKLKPINTFFKPPAKTETQSMVDYISQEMDKRRELLHEDEDDSEDDAFEESNSHQANLRKKG